MTQPTKPCSPEELEEIRKRCGAATPGPWEKELCAAGGEVFTENYFIARVERDCDLDFFHLAKTDIPRLLATIDLLNAAIDEVCQLAKSGADMLGAINTEQAKEYNYATAMKWNEELRKQLSTAREEILRLRRELFQLNSDDSAPCVGCGYSGDGFYQPEMHACAGPIFVNENGGGNLPPPSHEGSFDQGRLSGLEEAAKIAESFSPGRENPEKRDLCDEIAQGIRALKDKVGVGE